MESDPYELIVEAQGGLTTIVVDGQTKVPASNAPEGARLSWSVSEGSAVVTASNSGVVTGKEAGSATIICTTTVAPTASGEGDTSSQEAPVYYQGTITVLADNYELKPTGADAGKTINLAPAARHS